MSGVKCDHITKIYIFALHACMAPKQTVQHSLMVKFYFPSELTVLCMALLKELYQLVDIICVFLTAKCSFPESHMTNLSELSRQGLH